MHNSKICFKCNEKKELTEFYKHKEMFDGHLNKCIECTKKAVHSYRDKNIDSIREYDKNRANNPNRIEARFNYSKTIEGKESMKNARIKWIESNGIKRSASNIVNKNIKNGSIIKSYICEICKIKDVLIHGHHDDYAYPLNVRWLCSKCHSEWHKINGSGLNG